MPEPFLGLAYQPFVGRQLGGLAVQQLGASQPAGCFRMLFGCFWLGWWFGVLNLTQEEQFALGDLT